MEKEMKSVASIPPNYVSILHLQERWLKEKERKQKEGERGVKQEVGNGQGRREEKSVMKVVESLEPRVKKLEEPKCIEKEKLGDNGGGDLRKKKKNWAKKKKKNQSGSMEKVVKCESRVSPAYIRRENKPVKEDKYKAYDGVETQLQDLWISERVKEEGEAREVKGSARLSNGQGYCRNLKHDWSSTRVSRGTGAMVWVKKGKNDVAGGGNGV